jgi:F-type H+-transporting ATPase subunit delta
MRAKRQIHRDARKVFSLCQVDGHLDEHRFRAVVNKILQSRRRGYLSLLAELERLMRLEQIERRAEVESAEPLPPDLQTEVRAQLERTFGKNVDTSFALNPKLIGGMRVKVGFNIYDGSIRGGLTALQMRL